MDRVIEVLEAVVLLGLAGTFGSGVQLVKDKKKIITPTMLWGSIVALIAGAGLVIIKYASDTVVPLLYERKHLIVYVAILVVTAGLAYLYRKSKKSIPLVWMIVYWLAGLGIVLHLFW